jgi:hypothetical protein
VPADATCLNCAPSSRSCSATPAAGPTTIHFPNNSATSNDFSPTSPRSSPRAVAASVHQSRTATPVLHALLRSALAKSPPPRSARLTVEQRRRFDAPAGILIINEHHLRKVLAEYETHLNTHRPHQALNEASPRQALPDPVDADIKVIRRDRLGGLLHEYAQVA